MKKTISLLAIFAGVAVVCASAADVRESPVGLWTQIYSPDVQIYAKNLRAAGAPEATIAVLVSQAINARFKEREQALEPSLRSLQTLKEGWSAQRREALVQIRQEKNELLRQVLGIVPVETVRTEHIPEALANVAVEQRELVRLITEDYVAVLTRVHTESRGYLLEEDKEKLRYLEDEHLADLIKVLGVELALDYQIERDGYMRMMRQRLELFKPSLQELRDIYRVRRNAGLDVESRSPLGVSSNRLPELQKTVAEKLTELWGRERFAAYQRTTARQYQQIYHLVRRLNHSPAIADKIYDSQVAAIEGAYQKIQEFRTRGPRVITNGERLETPGDTSKALIAEHCALVKELLGEAGYAEYYQLNSRLIDAMNRGGIFRAEPSPFF